MGTPGFLSPEQARNEPLDDRTDLYSLGVVLYQMCAGRLPLVSDSVTGQMIAIIAHRPLSLQSVNADIPGPLSDLVTQLLEKEPRDRPRSAAILEQQIDEATRLCHSESQAALQIVTAQPETVPTKAAKKHAAKKQAATEQAIKKQEVTDSKPRPKKRTAWIPWASAGALLVIVLLVGLLGRPRRVPNPPVILSTSSPQSQPDPAIVRPASLRVLKLSSVSEAPGPIPRGNAAQFQVRIENRALDARSDPCRINAKSPFVAQVAAYLKTSGNERGESLLFPIKISERQLPRRGKSKPVDVMFMTADVLPGEFEVVFEFQAPDGTTISSQSAKLTVIENPAP